MTAQQSQTAQPQPPVLRFRDWDVNIQISQYAYSGGTAILLRAADTEHNKRNGTYPGEPIATASVNLEDADLADNEIAIKDWSENEGMAEWLVINGLVEDTWKTCAAGHVLAPIVRTLPKLFEIALPEPQHDRS